MVRKSGSSSVLCTVVASLHSLLESVYRQRKIIQTIDRGEHVLSVFTDDENKWGFSQMIILKSLSTFLFAL